MPRQNRTQLENHIRKGYGIIIPDTTGEGAGRVVTSVADLPSVIELIDTENEEEVAATAEDLDAQIERLQKERKQLEALREKPSVEKEKTPAAGGATPPAAPKPEDKK